MNRRSIIALAAFLAPVSVAAQGPTPLSPGAATASTRAGSACPTFSWSQADQAKGYELAVYEVEEQDVLKRRVRVILPSGSGSWTPSASECLSSGGQYGWAVRAMTSEGAGAWSSVALFSTSGAPSEDEVREALAVLRRYQDSSEVRAEESPEPLAALPAPADDEPEEADRLIATLDGPRAAAALSRVGERRGGAGLGSPPQRLMNSPNGTSLRIDGDFYLGGALFQSDSPILHTTGANNIALGPRAFIFGSGSGNSVVGADALFWNGGNANTAMGFSALLFNSLGGNNTAVGAHALQHNDSASGSTAVGAYALYENETGTHNTAVGLDALRSNTGGTGTEGSLNTAVGWYALRANTTGQRNTAVGEEALRRNTEGNRNTALGENSLPNSTGGDENTAIGQDVMFDNLGGSFNTAVGKSSLQKNKMGQSNTALGHQALRDTTGNFNTALGASAGANWTGANNIALGYGAFGEAGETGTIRIGGRAFQFRTFLAGVRGETTGIANAIPVLIDSNGQLGTVSSSARYKEDIADLGSRSAALMDLRPVAFRYKKAFADGEKPIQYGLIAEEVARVFPDLVVYSDDGEPETVKYHWLSTLLLNELQALRTELQRPLRNSEPDGSRLPACGGL